MSRSITFRCPDELYDQVTAACERRSIALSTFMLGAVRTEIVTRGIGKPSDFDVNNPLGIDVAKLHEKPAWAKATKPHVIHVPPSDKPEVANAEGDFSVPAKVHGLLEKYPALRDGDFRKSYGGGAEQSPEARKHLEREGKDLGAAIDKIVMDAKASGKNIVAKPDRIVSVPDRVEFATAAMELSIGPQHPKPGSRLKGKKK